MTKDEREIAKIKYKAHQEATLRMKLELLHRIAHQDFGMGETDEQDRMMYTDLIRYFDTGFYPAYLPGEKFGYIAQVAGWLGIPFQSASEYFLITLSRLGRRVKSNVRW